MATPPLKRAWRLMPPTPRAAHALSQALGLPPWVAQVLAHRGYSHPDEARTFLEPSLARLTPPHGLAGLEAALAVLAPALAEGRVIGVAGDYDADGVTATALVVDFLRASGGRVVWDLPHRLHDGYGFGPARARRLHAAGAEVVVTVDCGISDHLGVAEAARLGMAVVVTDHHQLPPGPMVPAAAVVNPQAPDCALCSHLAGVGVAFYLVAGLRAGLRDSGFFDGRPMPNLRQSLDLVAIGTCADVAPLLGENRILVAEGLRVLSALQRPGLAALAQVAGISPPFSARQMAFALAPRLNAAGRLAHPAPALELLLAPDTARALPLAQELNRLNQTRRDLEARILEQALAMIEDDTALQEARCLVLASSGWHRGVLGIVASRVVEARGRPALLLAVENGKAVGSGRSLPGFHLQQALCGQAHLLSHFGGHAQAVGCTLPAAAVPELAKGLDAAAAACLPPPEEGRPLEIEALVTLSELNGGSLEAMARLAPFGAGHPEPLLMARGLTAQAARVVGQGHLRLELTQDQARFIAFGYGMGHLLPQPGQRLDAVFTPRASSFQGRERLELGLEDLRPCDGRA